MAWLLDTNAWIQILKQPAGRLEQEVLSRTPSEIVFCSIVKAGMFRADAGHPAHWRIERAISPRNWASPGSFSNTP